MSATRHHVTGVLLLAAAALPCAGWAAAPVAADQELPKVLYIVPWKDADIGAPLPVPQLGPEAFDLQPLSRDSFRQQLRNQAGVPPVGSSAVSPVIGPAIHAAANPDISRPAVSHPAMSHPAMSH